MKTFRIVEVSVKVVDITGEALDEAKTDWIEGGGEWDNESYETASFSIDATKYDKEWEVMDAVNMLLSKNFGKDFLRSYNKALTEYFESRDEKEEN